MTAPLTVTEAHWGSTPSACPHDATMETPNRNVRDFAAGEITVSIWLTPQRDEAHPGSRNTSSETGSNEDALLG
jgi:hypothetical protein